MDWQKVTIFISSTFNDMHAERDYLIKNVFPDLQEWCEERKIHLNEVDLRWGVTAEDTENANTLGTCLKNIDKSRPFFLCFLGQRRGWIPNPEKPINLQTYYTKFINNIRIIDNISLETGKTYQDIIEFTENKSVTEIEIEHALISPMKRILKNKKTTCTPSEHGLFFFREDNYTEQLNEGQKSIYTNKDCDNPQEEDKKLEQFINEIKENDEFKANSYYGNWDKNLTLQELSHLNKDEEKGGLRDFNSWNKGIANFSYEYYRSLSFQPAESLKDIILRQLKEEIIKEYPDNEIIKEVSPLQHELDQQDLFREINTQGFIARRESFDELNSYLKNDDNKLCILTAKAGLGKTMLLANYATTLEQQIQKEKIEDLKIYTRFSGVSDKSSQQYDIWRSILEEAKIALPEDKNDLDDWVPNLEELKKNIKEVLNKIAEKGKTLIIIDGINQSDNGLAMLNYLPKKLPNNLKIILSFKDDDKENQELIKSIKSNNDLEKIELQELQNDEEKISIINKYLEQFLKALDNKEIEAICKTKGSDNPLLLKILLNELRLHGQYDTLAEQIQDFPSTPQEAFHKILERLEKDDTYKKIDSPQITKLIFGLLATARQGLTEKELIHSINIYQKEHQKEKIQVNDLKNIIRLNLRQVKNFMKRTQGRHDYFYESFKIAAQERYKENQIKFHQTLATYFKQKTDPKDDLSFQGAQIRDFDQLPYHLAKSHQIATLEEILSKYTWIKNKSELNNIYNTINDYKYINIENKENYHLKMIKNTLSMSSHILKDNIKDLPTQLWGRLKTNENSKIQEELLNEIEKYTNYPWLKPHHQMHTPEGPLQKTLTGHTRSVNSVCFSPDGKYIASGSRDYTVRVWNREKPDESPKILTGHTGSVTSVCFSPDGKYIASGSEDKTVRVWNPEKPDESPQILTGHTRSVNSVCFSPDGKYIASGSEDKTVRVWNLENPDESPQILKGHTSDVFSVCFSPDGRYIVSGSGDITVRVWNLENPEESPKILTGHTRRVKSVCFSPDGKYIASGSWDKMVRVWNREKPDESPQILKGHTRSVFSVCFSPDGKYIASGSWDETVRVWNREKPEESPRILKGHTGSVESVCFSPDGKYIASGGGYGDRTVRVWNCERPDESPKILTGHTSDVWSVCFSPDGNYIASGSGDETVRVWNLENPEESPQILKGHSYDVWCVCFSPDGKYIASGSYDSTVRVWNLENPEESPRILTGHTGSVSSVCFSPDGKYIASAGSHDKTVRVWNLENPEESPKILTGHTSNVYSVCFSPDGKYIASGSWDHTVRVWNLENPEESPKILTGHTGSVRSVCFSPDGKYIASGSMDYTVRVWNREKPDESPRILRHTSGGSVCFSPDGKYIASAGGNTVRVWNLGTNEKTQPPITLLNTEESISSCDFSKNNQQITAGGSSGQVLLYSIENLKQRIGITTALRNKYNTLSIRCSYCAKTIDTLKEEDLGTTIQCPHCKKKLKVNEFTAGSIAIEDEIDENNNNFNDSVANESKLSEEGYNENLEIDGSEDSQKGLTIIRTEHNSLKSVEEVKKAIHAQNPEVVAIELDKERYNYLRGNEFYLQNKVNDYADFINNFVLNHLDNCNEMKATIEVANETDAKIALVDRDILIPIYKFLNDIGRIKRAKLLIKLNSLANEHGYSLEKLEELFKEFSPSLYEENFVKRTSAFIAKKLLDLEEKNVIAVVSAKHKEGIQYYLDNPDEIPSMDVLLDSEKTKKKGFFSRLFKR
ncbi:MAG: DUF4062 domain-containing protein [Methanobrevibacter sp.]|nr:DUF4062 domain-containing protein [Methanobrevibacter sp.]